jgi:hypothetical protein
MRPSRLVSLLLSFAVAGSLIAAYGQQLVDQSNVADRAPLNAPENLRVGNTFMHLEVSPIVNRMPMARYQDPKTGLVEPDDRKMAVSFRLLADPGTTLPRILRAQTIWLTQDKHIWKSTDIEESGGASNSSSRDFLVHEGPHWKSLSPVDVVVRLVDWKGSAYFLAARQRRVLVVE